PVDTRDRTIETLQAHADSLEAQRGLYPPESQLESNRRAELRFVSAQLVTASQQRDERSIEAESVTGGGAVVAAARSASVTGPTPLRDAGVGAFLGFALGIGLALLRSNSDPRVFTLDAAAEATGVEVLAAIPRPGARTGQNDVRVRMLGRAAG